MGFAIGILATRGVNRPATAKDPFPGRTRTFQEMSRVARKQGVEVVVFSPRAVDKRRSRVLGWSCVPGRGWVQRYHPLPPVIYNRIANRRAEGRARVQDLLSWFKAQGVTVFNPRFLDKWEVYEALQSDPDLKGNVPETLLYTDPGQALDALRRWGTVFCKPRRGSLGTGIAALKLTRPGRVSICRNGVKVGTSVLRVSSPGACTAGSSEYLRPYRYCLQRASIWPPCRDGALTSVPWCKRRTRALAIHRSGRSGGGPGTADHPCPPRRQAYAVAGRFDACLGKSAKSGAEGARAGRAFPSRGRLFGGPPRRAVRRVLTGCRLG